MGRGKVLHLHWLDQKCPEDDTTLTSVCFLTSFHSLHATEVFGLDMFMEIAIYYLAYASSDTYGEQMSTEAKFVLLWWLCSRYSFCKQML